MKRSTLLLPLLLAVLAAQAGPAMAAEVVRDTLAAPANAAAAAKPPLVFDSADLGMGATVVFSRIPTPGELHDLSYFENVQHVMLVLPAWPEGYEAIEPLAQAALPEGADLVVVLPEYPETRRAAEAWNLLRRPVRLIVVVSAPPPDRDVILELNAIRGLERVVADLARPSRSGFERLQRPLNFRVVMP